MESYDDVWRNNTNHWGPPLTTDHFWTEAKLIYDHDLLLALAIDILALKIEVYSYRSYFAHILHAARISNVNSLIWVNGTQEMVNFSKKGDLFISSQTLDNEENILCLREESNVTLNEYLWLFMEKLEYFNKMWNLYFIENLGNCFH